MTERNTAVHTPVLLREVLRGLELRPGLVVVDGTVGAGGHSRLIATQIGEGGLLIGLDRDPMMLSLASAVLPVSDRVVLKHASYVELPKVIQELGLESVDRVLLDLGLSSDQLADRSRGFGFTADGPLDLRFDTSRGKPASELLAQASMQEIESWLSAYGEELESAKIARYLVARAGTNPIRTGLDLANGVAEALGVKRRDPGDKHPATRTFQALRIAVNQELEHVQRGIEDAVYGSLKPGGLAAIISFHSLEDRIVKQEFRRADRWESLTAKPIVASHQEQRVNPRSRSAKLRVAKRLG
ncbi:MAG TPA: 16S rRNA (cytosine(1402)-N(4))-methyltransferase RsmH [Schlesneria sp.]|jgi:16S rRNA (cytosine1402-N4)-methyltransferase